MRVQFRIALVSAGLVSLGAVLLLELNRSPQYFGNPKYLGAIIALEIVLACMWRFETAFFPATMVCFLLASTWLPFYAESGTLRWLFLTVGALAGLILWMRSDRKRHFGAFHLIALFCVLSALVSASTSPVPSTALLKAGSLFLLFLYSSTGGRIALAGREHAFVRGVVIACEILVFVVSISYFAGYYFFGGTNNLGAIIGVVATPVLLWAALTAENRAERQRRYTALALCGLLLYFTVCRAAIVADAVVAIVLTLVMRRPRLLLKAAFVAALFLEVVAVTKPSQMARLMNSFSGRFIFKSIGNRPEVGALGSRESPWSDTISSVERHPWFGTGFGTSDLGEKGLDPQGSWIHTVEGSNREHGSSYLALAEYMGLLGILPFLFLLILLVRAVARACMWMRRTHSARHYAAPFAMVIVAGLVHASFEDWLFAAGFYLCVFFWVSAFLLVDLTSEISSDVRQSNPEYSSSLSPAHSFRQPTS
jgi:O-antigen ligase